MTGCCKRLLRRFAPRNDGKKRTRNDGEGGTCNEEKGKSFRNQNNLLVQKIFKFFQRSHNCLNSQPLKSHFYFSFEDREYKRI